MQSGIVLGVKLLISEVSFVIDAQFDPCKRSDSLSIISAKLKEYATQLGQKLYFNGEIFYIGKRIDKEGFVDPNTISFYWEPFTISGLQYAMYSVHDISEV